MANKPLKSLNFGGADTYTISATDDGNGNVTLSIGG